MTKRINMIKVREILRLRFSAELSIRQIARSQQLSVGVVSKYVKRAEALQLGWPLPDSLSDQVLLQQLQPEKHVVATLAFTEPDFQHIHQELKRKGMTLQLLWEEYAEAHPEHYSYSRFTVLYRTWRGAQQLSMRQVHLAGEKLFVDYCGPTLPVVDPRTGAIRTAQVFVAVLGASSYTYAEATWSQSLPDWLNAHARTFSFLGGVPRVVIPDNLKSAVIKACRYEPELNPSYQQLAEHYGVAIIPARPYKPKDKAKAEVGVQVVERWIMMRLRHQTFHSLAALNQSIRLLLDDLNQRPFKQRPGSRATAFTQLDQPALRPLPDQPYVYRDIKQARVHLDYHVAYDQHFYSVPYQLVKQVVRVQADEHLITIFHGQKQVAQHARVYGGGHTTDPAHMAKAHLRHQEWSPKRFLSWAASIGEHTTYVVEHQLSARRHPEHGYRACLGLLNLAKKYTPQRLERACQRARLHKAMTYKSINTMLSKGLDNTPLPEGDAHTQSELPLVHDHVRGPDYYH